jgi:hypothetical protein
MKTFLGFTPRQDYLDEQKFEDSFSAIKSDDSVFLQAPPKKYFLNNSIFRIPALIKLMNERNYVIISFHIGTSFPDY